MRVVDGDTRRIVQKNRLDALEGDNLFDDFGDQEENLIAEAAEGLWEEDEAEEVASDDDVISEEEEPKDAIWD